MEREHHIDGLRGWAALMVLVSHFLCAFYPATDTLQQQDVRINKLEATLSQTPFNIWYNGNFAVCIFFVISGYVLSTSFFARKNSEMVYSSAYRRYLRLMIPVILTSLFYYVVLSQHWFVSKEIDPVGSSPWLKKMWNTEPSPGHFLRSTFYDLIFRRDIEPPYNPALWSIGIELKGSYLVYGFLIALGANRRRWIGYVLLVCFTLKSYYLLFVTGMLICDLHHQSLLRAPKRWEMLLLIIITIYTGSYKYTSETSFWQPLDYVRGIIKPQAIGSICIFYVCMHSRIAATFLKTGFSAFLGKVSYSVYLIHLLIIGTLSGLIFSWLYITCMMSYVLSTFISFGCSIMIVLCAAKICTRLIDDTGVTFSKWLYNKTFSREN